MNNMFDIIAEIGQAHEGSLGIAHSYIDAVAKRGVNTIKFQTHIAAAESSSHEPFRVNFSYEDDTRFAYWNRMEFTEEQWVGIKEHCDEVGIEFLSSPFSLAAVELLERIGVKRYKIGSGEVSNHLMLERIAQTGKPILLSSGMSSFSEIDAALNVINEYSSPVSVFQCTTSYPTHPENWGLNVISDLIRRYDYPIGFSDHSGDIYACLLAAAHGARLFEFHVVFDKEMFGPDAKSSLDLNQLESLVKGLRQYELSLNHKINKDNNEHFADLKAIFEKSLAVNKDLQAGHILSLADLEAKKPKGFGIDADQFKGLIGKELKRPLKQWDFLNRSDINE